MAGLQLGRQLPLVGLQGIDALLLGPVIRREGCNLALEVGSVFLLGVQLGRKHVDPDLATVNVLLALGNLAIEVGDFSLRTLELTTALFKALDPLL